MIEIMTLLAAVPQTGDRFPKALLIGIILCAVLLAVGTAVFAKKKGAEDEEEDDE